MHYTLDLVKPISAILFCIAYARGDISGLLLIGLLLSMCSLKYSFPTRTKRR